MTIGEKIKKRRLDLGLTLEDVASYVGVSKPTVQRWETGVIGNMKADRVQKIAEILLVSVDYILGNSEDIEDIIVAKLRKQAIKKIELMSEVELKKLLGIMKYIY